ncbi:MAG: hypothetical protein CMM01_16800 [Rhodopirellula sp.]|nr:hypothetical protein [Rhodopirellula sp.]
MCGSWLSSNNRRKPKDLNQNEFRILDYRNACPREGTVHCLPIQAPQEPKAFAKLDAFCALSRFAD